LNVAVNIWLVTATY